MNRSLCVLDEHGDERLIELFNKNCPNDKEILKNCYKNKIFFNSGYISDIEKQIESICKVAHKDEPTPGWWWILSD